MSFTTAIKKGLYSAKDFLGTNSGTILVVGGNILGVAAIVTAFRAGKKIDEHRAKCDDDCNEFNKIYTNYVSQTDGDQYTEDAYKKDIAKTKRVCVLKCIKTAALPVGLEVASLVCSDLAYIEKHKQFMKASAAAVGYATALAAYRKNVVDELGEDMDKHFMYGISAKEKNVTLVTTDEDGNEVETKEKCKVVENVYNVSPYAMWWLPETTNRYQSDEYYFKDFVVNTEKYFNDILVCKPKITVNEIKDYLGAKSNYLTLKGQAAGWKEGDTIKIDVIKVARPIGNGKYEPAFILDFNCHYILDKYPDVVFGQDELDVSYDAIEVV